jgi:hypothetical protein
MPPGVPVDTSATMAPTTAVAAPSRRAGSTYGTLAGSRSETRVRHQPAACARNRSVCAGVGDCRPRSAPTATGKNAR